MAFTICDQHPDQDAVFRCEGCGKALCSECVTKSHALILCGLCGERALPLDQQAPATVREMEKQAVRERPYSLAQAFMYPFRGLGKYGYLATLVTMAFVSWVVTFGFGCGGWLVGLGFWSMLVGLQFKIVRSTAEGDTELPDWPEYAALRERVVDLLAYGFIAALQFALPIAFIVVLNPQQLITHEPNLAYWIAFAFVCWVGAALSMMAMGAAGQFGAGAVLRLDLHVRGFLAAGADALTVTNLVFVLGLAMFLVRFLLAAVPLAGSAVSGAIGAYWLFTSAHLTGLVFRRHLPALDALYD